MGKEGRKEGRSKASSSGYDFARGVNVEACALDLLWTTTRTRGGGERRREEERGGGEQKKNKEEEQREEERGGEGEQFQFILVNFVKIC